jgi:hypothetical protein
MQSSYQDSKTNRKLITGIMHNRRPGGGCSADIAAALALRDQHHRKIGRPLEIYRC